MEATTINHGIVTPPQTPPPAAPPPAGAGEGAGATSWLSGLSPEVKGFVENKGFDSVETLARSYQGLEKLRGVPEERLLKLPEKSDDPEWQKIYNKLGRPEKPEGYSLPNADKEGGKQFAEWARKAFHDLGLTSKQATSLAEKWYAQAESAKSAHMQANEQKLNEEGEALKSKWGAAYEQNINLGKEAAKAFGIEAETLDLLEKQMGFSKVMEFMHAIGSKIQPDQFISGGKGGGFGSRIMSPDAARARLEELKSDQGWLDRFSKGGLEEREEKDRLDKAVLGLN